MMWRGSMMTHAWLGLVHHRSSRCSVLLSTGNGIPEQPTSSVVLSAGMESARQITVYEHTHV